MWSVTRIDEADYGCEERMPGEPLLVLVTIESDDGRMCRFECAENWLLQQGKMRVMNGRRILNRWKRTENKLTG